MLSDFSARNRTVKEGCALIGTTPKVPVAEMKIDEDQSAVAQLQTGDLTATLDAAVRDGIEKIVVGAIISRDGKVLVLRRRQDDFLGGLDELPSGHVEHGESVLAALRREVKEETGLVITRINGLVGQFDYLTGSGKKARQLNFATEVSCSESDITLTEHSAYSWTGPKEAQALNLSENVSQVLALYWS